MASEVLALNSHERNEVVTAFRPRYTLERQIAIHEELFLVSVPSLENFLVSSEH